MLRRKADELMLKLRNISDTSNQQPPAIRYNGRELISNAAIECRTATRKLRSSLTTSILGMFKTSLKQTFLAMPERV
jgi:hypothetical protein